MLQHSKPPWNNSGHLLCIQHKSGTPQLRQFQILSAVLEKPLTSHWINSKGRTPLRMPSTKIMASTAPTPNAIHRKESPSLKVTISFTRWKHGNNVLPQPHSREWAPRPVPLIFPLPPLSLTRDPQKNQKQGETQELREHNQRSFPWKDLKNSG